MTKSWKMAQQHENIQNGLVRIWGREHTEVPGTRNVVLLLFISGKRYRDACFFFPLL